MSSYCSGVQGRSGPSEESEGATTEVPAAVTVEVEEIHPLPEVKNVSVINALYLYTLLVTLIGAPVPLLMQLSISQLWSSSTMHKII